VTARASPWQRRSVVLFLLLAVSVAGNVALFLATRSYYAHEQDVRLDPIGLRVHEALRAKAAAHAKPVVAMFGDSRIAMWTPPTVEGYDVVNLGIGNQTTEQVLLRFDDDVAPLHPAALVIQVGVNDLKALPLFPARQDEIVRDCKANIARIVEKSRGLGAKVILLTIFSLGDVPIYRRAVWSAAPVAHAIDDVNAYLRSLAGDAVVVVDSAATLDGEPGKVKPSYQVDYLHENPAAYAALDARVVPLVQSLRAVKP
jgi:lysophospholipase L1-like esterase